MEESGKSVCVRLKDCYWIAKCHSLISIDALPFVEALLGEEAFDPWSTNAIPELNPEQAPAESQAWRDQTLKEASMAAAFSRSARSPISEEVLEALRSVNRKGRDVVIGLSNACCKWGCSKSEISSLC